MLHLVRMSCLLHIWKAFKLLLTPPNLLFFNGKFQSVHDLIDFAGVVSTFSLSLLLILDLYKNTDMMCKQSVWTSTISSHLASLHLKPGGLLTLSGAKASLDGTPGTVVTSILTLLRCVTHLINVFSAQVYLRILQNWMFIV